MERKKIKVIVNADDFGQTRSCTDATIEAFNKGYITDTTMVANGDVFEYAVNLIKEHHLEDRIGIHFNITEGEPLTEKIKKCSRFVSNGNFNRSICRNKFSQFIPLNKLEKEAVYEECSAQVEKLVNAGIPITHADSHHHVHTKFVLRPIIFRICHESGITKIRPSLSSVRQNRITKLRNTSFSKQIRNNGMSTIDYFCRASEVQESELYEGVIELMTHPDIDENGNCIDRKNIKDFPVGKRLESLAKQWEGIDKITYKNIDI